MNSKLKPASSRFKATSTRSKRIPSASRSEEHTSELQSLTNLVCRLLLEKKEHTSELQSLTNLVCRLLLAKQKEDRVRHPPFIPGPFCHHLSRRVTCYLCVSLHSECLQD